MGGYQLFAHIIQGNQLAARDSSGESDPVVKCTLSRTGEMLMTETRQKTLNPIFEENLTFDFEVSTPGEMLASNFVMEVWDADALGDDMIGSFQLDLGKVWDSPSHRLFRRWVSLMDDTDDEHVGIVPISGSRRLEHAVVRCIVANPVHDAGDGVPIILDVPIHAPHIAARRDLRVVDG